MCYNEGVSPNSWLDCVKKTLELPVLISPDEDGDYAAPMYELETKPSKGWTTAPKQNSAMSTLPRLACVEVGLVVTDRKAVVYSPLQLGRMLAVADDEVAVAVFDHVQRLHERTPGLFYSKAELKALKASGAFPTTVPWDKFEEAVFPLIPNVSDKFERWAALEQQKRLSSAVGNPKTPKKRGRKM